MTLVAALTPVSSYRVGDLRWYAGSVAVSGATVVNGQWLVANGASVSRTTYAKLFAEIGTTYGSVDGTHFNLPNYTDGVCFLSKGATNFTTRGASGGAQTVALANDGSQDPAHTHTQYNSGGGPQATGSVTLKSGQESSSSPPVYPYLGGGGSQGGGGNTTGTTNTIAGRAGGNPSAHQNMPPIQVVGGMLIRFV